MKVILLRDVAKLGKRFSVVVVPDGYALNKLIPQGMAQPATPENLKRVEAKTAATAAHSAADEASVAAVIAKLNETSLSILVDANAQDHLFKAVKASDISEAAAALGYRLPSELITLAEPIKSLGNHLVSITLGSVKGTIAVMVQRRP